MREAGKVVGTEAAADAERRKGGIGEDDALAGAALEFEDEFGERLAAEAQERGLPGEGAGNFVGRSGGDDDGGGGRCRGGGRGSEGNDGALVGHEVERLDRKTLKRVGVNALHPDFAFGDENVDGGGLEVNVDGGADGADIDIAGADDEGAGGIFGDGEMRFAAGEEHAALGDGELLDHFAAGVELDDGAVGEGELARTGGWCGGGGGREGRRGKCRGSREADRDEGEGCGGRERPKDDGAAPEGAAARGGGEHGRGGAFRNAVEKRPRGRRALQGGGVTRIGGEPEFVVDGLGRGKAAVATDRPLRGGGAEGGVVGRGRRRGHGSDGARRKK